MAVEQGGVPFLQFNEERKEQNNGNQINEHKQSYIKLLTVLFDICVIFVTLIDMMIKTYVVMVRHNFETLELIYLVAVHIIYMLLFATSTVKLVNALTPVKACLMLFVLLILSPFIPFMVYICRYFRNNQYFKTKLQQYFELEVIKPYYPLLFETDLFNNFSVCLILFFNNISYSFILFFNNIY